MTEYYDSLETRSQHERDHARLSALQHHIRYAREHSPAYADLLAEFADFTIDSVDTMAAAMAALPLTRKSDLPRRQAAAPPFGGFAPSGQPFKYIFASPGPIYEPVGLGADYWRFARALFAAGFRHGDRVHCSFSYHLTPAGQMLDSGCHALGCSVIPAGVGQTELQLEVMRDLKPNGYVGTPSFLRILVERAALAGHDITSLSKALVSGEALPPSTRQFLSEQGVAVRECYASADLGLIAYESVPQQGLIIDEGVYLEIVKPGSGDPLPYGEVGEVVVTTFNPDYPLVRFATGDLSAILPGESECGRTNLRLKGWLGRADQTAKVRGMFIYPTQIDQIVKRHAAINKARLVVEWRDHKDDMTLHCESSTQDESLRQAVEQSIRDVCKVRGQVRLVRHGDLPNDGIVIEDVREYMKKGSDA